MRFLYSLILSFIVFTASFQHSLMIFDYQMNKNFYEIHCINKSKPELECHGKCQIKKESEKTASLVNLVKYSFEFNILPLKEVSFSINPIEKSDFQKVNFLFLTSIFPLGLYSVDPHPPQI